MDRNARSHHRQTRRTVQSRARRAQAVDYFNILTSPQLLDITEAYLPEHRERLYPPTVTLSMFMRQALEADASCQKAVNGWAAQRAADGLRPMSVRTGGYCRARQRLPLTMVRELARETGRQLHEKVKPAWKWRGRPVKLVDGTGISMPDTPSNQARFPQPGSQAEGVGFPLAYLVAVICLASGAVLEAALGTYAGKGSGELAAFRMLQSSFRRGDVIVADALYCHYFLMASMIAAGVDVVMEQHGSRRTDFRRGKFLGTHDHIVMWPKPQQCPAWMTREQYQAFPDELMVRESRLQHRVLVTTMLDARRTSKQDLSQLYAGRWNVELDLRNIKTTMGMDVLHCQTAHMNEKEIWVHLLTYNVIRLLMAQAASHYATDPRALSFKHTVQLWTEWLARGLTATHDQSLLFSLIAQSRVGNRPGRIEPRMRKRRPKSYPWLKEPRHIARERARKYGHAPRA
jgi:Transposase DDE domain